MPAANRTQALVPAGAAILPNPRGTAPGLWLTGPPGEAVLLPGVPFEMRGLLAEQVCPRLAARAGIDAVTRSRVLRTTGMAESALADRLHGVEDRIAPATLAYLPTLDGVDLRVTAWRTAAGRADALLADATAILRDALGDRCYGEDGADLAAIVLDRLRGAERTLAVAESCTGGMLGSRLTAVPGSSDVFVGGVVAYHNRVKREVLGVSAEQLEEDGAVSEVVAATMAHRVAEHLRADCGLAVSGIAGPGGGTDAKPVGTVCLAAVVPGAGAARTRTTIFPGDRHAIRARATQAALDLLRTVQR